MEKPRLQSYVPFDLYDFFGYLFPGLMVVVYVVTFEYLTFPQAEPFFLKIIAFVGTLPWFLGLFFAIAAILFVYVIGHFVGALSSIGFDRILMEGIYGYPVVSLLQFKRERHSYSEATHRYIFLFFNLFLIVVLLTASDYHFQTIAGVILVMVILLIMARVIIKWIKVSRKGISVLRLAENKLIRLLFLKPSWILEWFEDNAFKAIVGIDKPFPEEFRAKYVDLFTKIFRMNPEKLSSENYWMSYLYATTQNPSIIGLLKTWLHLYGFARNVSTATFLCLFGFAVARFYYVDLVNDANRVLFGGMILTAWVFMARYWMLHQSYHTKNVLRAFVATAEIASAEGRTSKSR